MTRVPPGGPTLPLLIDRSELALIGAALKHGSKCARGFDDNQVERAEQLLRRLRGIKTEIDAADAALEQAKVTP